jgi:uncharacterized protein
MERLRVFFPASGVETWVFVPLLVAFAVSSVTAVGGVSGAFVLLPFQVSVLGFTGPGVSATNFVYNLIAIPGGAYRYFKEGRMSWPLVWVLIAGTVPGVFLGYAVRVAFLLEPRSFKAFVGAVLLFVGARLLYERRAGKAQACPARELTQPEVRPVSFTLTAIEFEFLGERYRVSVPKLLLLSLVVGVVGGAYGIGGGSIIAPFCVTAFELPVYAVAGPALVGTFVASVVGVVFYSVLPFAGASTAPDWWLGSLFGLGGMMGTYLGARAQRHVPQRIIKLGLGALITVLALQYLVQFFV